MERAHPRNRRVLLEKWILVSVLPGVAGAVNASGLLEVGQYTSHMSGHVARIGDELAQGDAARALDEIALVATFLCGAVFASILMQLARHRGRPRYALALSIEALLLAAHGLLAAGGRGSLFVLTTLFCFAMGLQNALVTKTSNAVVRSTHLTGVVTDIGIEIGRVLFTFARSGSTATTDTSEEPQKLKLHVTILTSFLVGAILGPGCYLRFHSAAVAFPCSVLLALAIFDAVFGLGSTGGTARFVAGLTHLVPESDSHGLDTAPEKRPIE